MSNLSVGIVGLPNVGKSSLFNALLKKKIADVANYPFCTIEPNIGIVAVPDERLSILAKIVNTQKIVPAAVEFYDIAGLVKGASQGEGLGNQFLAHIREVTAIIHVVRLFDNNDIIHVNKQTDPLTDISIVEQELILADLETLTKQKEQNNSVIMRLKKELNKGISAREIKLTDEEKADIKQLNLLTLKPVLYLFNVSEKQLEHKFETEEKINRLITKNPTIDNHYLYLCVKLENEILDLSPFEQKEYLAQFSLLDTGLNRLIKKSYQLLKLISFLTAGKLEVRAWTIKKNTPAPKAAGVIHTDFEKHFIKADIVSFQDFVACQGWTKAREQGKVKSVGKDYLMQEDDIVEFKVGI